MAALSQFPPSLQVTTAEDDMEISSQIGHYDHDIDIDLDLHSEGGGDQDIDVQLDDARSEAGSMMQTHDSDMVQDHDNPMYDEQEREDTAIDMMVGDQPHLIQESVDPGFDDIADPYDVVIADATSREQNDAINILSGQLEFDDVLEDNILQDQAQSQEDLAATSVLEGEAADSTDRQGGNKHSPLDAIPADNSIEREVPNEATDHAEDPDKLLPPGERTDLPGPDLSSQAPEAGAQSTLMGISATSNNEYQDPDALEHPEQQDAETAHGEDTGETNDQEAERPGTHSIIVSYDDARFSLFPPANDDESAEFLLQDSSLVSRSLVELFRACRDVLGDDVSEEEELKLACRDLGLEISEESAHAFSTSLSEILEVFLDLHRLDGVESPDPFEISLEKKERFTAGLSRLRAAVSDGRGMSSLWQEWNDDVESHLGGDAQEGQAQEERKAEEGGGDISNQSVGEYEVAAEHGVTTTKSEEQALATDDPGTSADQRTSEESSASVENQPSRHERAVEQPQVGFEDENGDDLHRHGQIQEEQSTDAQQTAENEGVGNLVEENTHEEEDLIDYLEEEAEDEVKSSDSSTIIGDAAAATDADYTTEAQRLHNDSAEGSFDHIDIPHDAYLEDEAQQPGDFGADDFGADNNYAKEFEDTLGEAGGSTTYGVQDQNDHVVAADAGGGTIIDDIDWADPTQPDGTDQETRAEEFGQASPADGDDWAKLAEHEVVDDTTVSWPAHESALDSKVDLQGTSDPLATAEGDLRGELGNASDNEPFDERDEITFDTENDEDGDGLDGDVGHEDQPSTTDLPDQSPLGKRSFTEHLHGDNYGEGSELGGTSEDAPQARPADGYPEAKRLRST